MKNNFVIYRFYDLYGSIELTDSQVHYVNIETINDHLPTDFYVNEKLYKDLVEIGEIEIINGSSMVTLTYF